jgi:hypothetical protein
MAVSGSGSGGNSAVFAPEPAGPPFILPNGVMAAMSGSMYQYHLPSITFQKLICGMGMSLPAKAGFMICILQTTVAFAFVKLSEYSIFCIS